MKAVGINADEINSLVEGTFFASTYKDEETGEDKPTQNNKVL